MSDTPTMDVRVDRFLAETEKAILVRFTAQDGGQEQAWLPKSQIAYFGCPGDNDVLIEIPEWLAEANEMDHLNP